MSDYPSRQELLADCHQLINQISRRPGYLKLLPGAKEALKIYANYKANRG